MLSERLLSERERLCLSQTELAEKCGVTARTQRNYEKGERQPDSSYLAALALVGVDVMYVLTGQRINNQPSLNPRETALLDNYRHCDEDGQNAVEQVAFIASKPSKELADGNKGSKTAS